MVASSRPKPFVLLILDGYGISFVDEGNAIKAAKTPALDRLMREYPLASIKAAGIEVGLPWGEMGNSETGHQNIGSGQLIYQALPRISMAIEDGSFFKNPAFLDAVEHVKKNPDAVLHTMGVLSNGGIHGHIDHQIALLKFAAEQGIGDRLYVHAFLDGRDSPPDSGSSFVSELHKEMKKHNAGTLSTIIGRYYSMDRAQNWNRTREAYEMLVYGKGQSYPTWKEAVQTAYDNLDDKNFETTPPLLIAPDEEPPRLIQDGDAVIFYNYRADRAKQLMAAFTDPKFNKFAVEHWKNLKFVTMTEYEKRQHADIAFPEEKVAYPLGRVLSENKLKQLRIAEGEKFAHVTYFFNGGNDDVYPGEDRIKIESLKIKDVSKNPEMKIKEVADRVVKEIHNDTYDVIIVNFANPDMIAHTGKYKATIKAVEETDAQVERVVHTVLAQGGSVLLTCDHGNAETVINQLTHNNTTDHTNNPVPVIYISPENKQDPPKGDEIVEQLLLNPIGVLADIAPTVLTILDLPPPKSMTAQSILESLA